MSSGFAQPRSACGNCTRDTSRLKRTWCFRRPRGRWTRRQSRPSVRSFASGVNKENQNRPKKQNVRGPSLALIQTPIGASVSQGLKPKSDFALFAAWLKPGPDTNRGPGQALILPIGGKVVQG